MITTLLADDTPRTFLNDPWTAGLLFTGLIGSLLGLAFSLGVNLSRLRMVERKQEDHDKVVEKIFKRLDDLTSNPSHVCSKAEKIAQMDVLISEHGRRVESLERWRDQQTNREGRVAERFRNQVDDEAKEKHNDPRS